jgi:hypothetical protein
MNRSVFTFVTSILVLFAFLLSGCTPPKTETVKVTGKITLDGKPIEQGAIKFIAADGSTPAGGGSISNGTYLAEVPPGKKKVLVNGQKVVGKEPLYKDMPDSPTRDKLERTTPLIYNNQEASPLEAEISGETKDLDFDLNSKIRSL